jgi:hypothetical protein
MGRKGVSIRKPRKSKSSSNNTGGYSNIHTGENSPVHSLVKDRSAPLNRGSMHPLVETNKKPNK